MKSIVLLLVVLCSVPIAYAGKRKPKGPTLQETTDYIVQILNVDGFTVGAIPGVSGYSFSTKLSNAHASGCSISYDVTDEKGGVFEKTGLWQFVDTFSIVLDLRSTVAKSVFVGTGSIGNHYTSVRLSHPITVIKHTKDERNTTSARTEQIAELNFELSAVDSAERLGNALNYAISLCGGGKVDPFKPR